MPDGPGVSSVITIQIAAVSKVGADAGSPPARLCDVLVTVTAVRRGTARLLVREPVASLKLRTLYVLMVVVTFSLPLPLSLTSLDAEAVHSVVS